MFIHCSHIIKERTLRYIHVCSFYSFLVLWYIFADIPENFMAYYNTWYHCHHQEAQFRNSGSSVYKIRAKRSILHYFTEKRTYKEIITTRPDFPFLSSLTSFPLAFASCVPWLPAFMVHINPKNNDASFCERTCTERWIKGDDRKPFI